MWKHKDGHCEDRNLSPHPDAAEPWWGTCSHLHGRGACLPEHTPRTLCAKTTSAAHSPARPAPLSPQELGSVRGRRLLTRHSSGGSLFTSGRGPRASPRAALPCQVLPTELGPGGPCSSPARSPYARPPSVETPESLQGTTVTRRPRLPHTLMLEPGFSSGSHSRTSRGLLVLSERIWSCAPRAVAPTARDSGDRGSGFPTLAQRVEVAQARAAQ